MLLDCSFRATLDFPFYMNHLCVVGYASFASSKLKACLCAFDQMCFFLLCCIALFLLFIQMMDPGVFYFS